MKMLRLKNNIDTNFRFIYYAMKFIKFEVGEHSRHWISKYSQIEIPIPPLAVQERIVEILDKFTALTAELQARQQQYEYYRNHLLSFGGLDNIRSEVADSQLITPPLEAAENE